jgi:1-acyl-sn-glycerol-3-phosphate acyltransferase
MWRWFSWYAERFLRKHFHAVRRDLAVAMPALRDDEPVIFFCNHPSWWDPMIGIFIASRCWPDRKHYWPIDAGMLRKYRFLGKLGFFGVDASSLRGAAGFLRTGSELLNGSNCIWITAQGEFADVRKRPIDLKPGIARLCARGDRGVIVPVAAEYPFWSEKTPEALLRFGEPVPIADRPTIELLESRLTGAMDALALSAMSRDPARFETLLGGSTGTSGIYDLWRRFGAALKGRRFDPSHMPDPGSPT